MLRSDIEENVDGEQLFKAQCQLYHCGHDETEYHDRIEVTKLPSLDLAKNNKESSAKKNNYHENFVKIDVRHDRRKSLLAKQISLKSPI